MKEHTYTLSTMPSNSNTSGILARGLSEAQLFDYLRSQFRDYQTFSAALEQRFNLRNGGVVTFIVDPVDGFSSGYISHKNAYAFIRKE